MNWNFLLFFSAISLIVTLVIPKVTAPPPPKEFVHSQPKKKKNTTNIKYRVNLGVVWQLKLLSANFQRLAVHKLCVYHQKPEWKTRGRIFYSAENAIHEQSLVRNAPLFGAKSLGIRYIRNIESDLRPESWWGGGLCGQRSAMLRLLWCNLCCTFHIFS